MAAMMVAVYEIFYRAYRRVVRVAILAIVSDMFVGTLSTFFWLAPSFFRTLEYNSKNIFKKLTPITT
jgi:hypothetical protein